MRTKSLFSAAILVGMLAACTNEDLVTTANNAVSPEDGRPVVNAKLGMSFGDQPNTRVIYDSNDGYQFEVGNKIGAILMDEIAQDADIRPFTSPNKWAALSWLGKYSLVNYSHTDYPFTCTEVVGDGTVWESDAKMLEGNYFFAYPYEGYDAKRQVSHSIINQKQNGGDAKAAYDSYAKNQFFIGYAQIKEGNDTKEALTSVNMTSVLGGVFFRLKNVASAADLTVTKIVLSGKDIRSVLTFDPTTAEYKGEGKVTPAGTDYNLRNGKISWWTPAAADKFFNYANYLGLKDDLYNNADYDQDEDYVYNIPAEETDNYKRANALRQVAVPYETDGVADNYAELAFTEGGKEGFLLKAKGENTLTACIMINPIEVSAANDLVLSIYTTKGVIKNIDLSEVKVEGATVENTTITGQPIKKVGPEVSNIVDVQFDDNSVQAPVETGINNSDDLKQYISWITSISGNTRLNVMTLNNNATIDAETAKMIEDKFKSAAGGKDGLALYVESVDPEVGLQIAAPEATDSPEAIAALQNILNYIIVDKDCPVKVLGTANIGETTLNRDFKAIKDIVQEAGMTATLPANGTSNLMVEVAKGATLNVIGDQLDGNGLNPIKVAIENNGTLNVNEEGDITMALINGTATDAAEVNVNGKVILAANSKNDLKGVITVAEDAYLSGTLAQNFRNMGIMHNHGAIWNIKNVNNSSIKPATVYIYKEATTSNFDENAGVIVYDVLTANNKVTGTITATGGDLGRIQYTTTYADDEANKSIDTKTVVDYSITELTVTKGTLDSNFGRPTATGSYTATTLKALVLKGSDIKMTGTQYPLVMQAAALFQVEGTVDLGTSVVADGFDAKSYITGTVNVSQKVAFASAVEAQFNASSAFTGNVLTVAVTPALKSATIDITAGKFLAVENVIVARNTSNRINANGTLLYKENEDLPAAGLTVSGTSEQTTITEAAGTVEDK